MFPEKYGLRRVNADIDDSLDRYFFAQRIVDSIKKQEDQWYLTTKFNCKAQESAINRLLDTVLEMTGKVRSTDPKHLEQYKITDEQGIHLILKDEAEKTLVNLIIGKKSEDYNTGFVRFAGKDKVYFVDKNVLSNLSISGDIDTVSVVIRHYTCQQS